jgi:hypothetical protein
MRLKHYLSCMLILLSFVTVNAQEKKELKEGDQAPTFKYLDINVSILTCGLHGVDLVSMSFLI